MHLTIIFIPEMHGLSDLISLHQKCIAESIKIGKIYYMLWDTICLSLKIPIKYFRVLTATLPIKHSAQHTRFVAGLFICDKFVIQSYVASGSEWRCAFFVISASKQTMPVVQQLANKPVLLICPRQKQSGQYHRMGKGLHFIYPKLAGKKWLNRKGSRV